MARLGEVVEKIRSKNAGPFWVTVDIFCGSAAVFEMVQARLDTASVCHLVDADPLTAKRFDIDELAVVKFSFIRTAVQGSRFDRDMHGAQLAVLFAEMDV
ncbi:DUF4387 domain-containing protein [bacterium]|jgi:hypothetical protein|nr:DUF4387 domain-containing protein [bacterium]